ncbi:MAG: sulfatase-like hydrolase/transferase, partial [Acidimicrobiia bacterium]|nr:sulfatase-like hydrolase/transferase [Acidimicrobiia bacterium]
MWGKRLAAALAMIVGAAVLPIAVLAAPANNINDNDQLAALAETSVPEAEVAAASSSQPNFVVIVSDDQRWDTVGRCSPTMDPFDFSSGEDACMPNLQALLQESGTTYLRGEVTQALCCPSRASILSGQYSTTTGITTNNGFPFDDSSTVATWLNDAGYRTGLVGKYLNGYGSGPLSEYLPPGWDSFEAFHGLTNDESPYLDYTWISFDEGSTTPEILDIDDANSTSGEACADGNYYSTDYICNRALDFISADTTTPFFAYLAPIAPHDPTTIADRHVNDFYGIGVTRYPSTNVAPSPNPPSYLPTQPFNSRNLDRVDRARIGAIEATLAIDDMIGEIYDELEADGRLDNTVWFFISDNGVSTSEHLWKNKGWEYYDCHQVPYVVVCPPSVCPGAEGGTVDAENYVLNIDIAPTVADLAGVTPTLTVDGLSLAPILSNPDAAWRDEWFIYGNDPHYDGIVGVGLDGTWYKYVVFPDVGEYELYDEDNDPYETINLAGNSAYAAVEADLAARLAAHVGGEPPANQDPSAA